MSPSHGVPSSAPRRGILGCDIRCCAGWASSRSEEHTSELQSQSNLVCRLLLEKKNNLNTLAAGCHFMRNVHRCLCLWLWDIVRQSVSFNGHRESCSHIRITYSFFCVKRTTQAL